MKTECAELPTPGHRLQNSSEWVTTSTHCAKGIEQNEGHQAVLLRRSGRRAKDQQVCLLHLLLLLLVFVFPQKPPTSQDQEVERKHYCPLAKTTGINSKTATAQPFALSHDVGLSHPAIHHETPGVAIIGSNNSCG